MADAKIEAIRNAAEIAWFAGIDFASHGIDATGEGDLLADCTAGCQEN